MTNELRTSLICMQWKSTSTQKKINTFSSVGRLTITYWIPINYLKSFLFYPNIYGWLKLKF